MKKNYTHFIEQYKTLHTGVLKDTLVLGVEHLEYALQSSKERNMKTIAIFHIRNYTYWEVLLRRINRWWKDNYESFTEQEDCNDGFEDRWIVVSYYMGRVRRKFIKQERYY